MKATPTVPELVAAQVIESGEELLKHCPEIGRVPPNAS